MSLDKAVSDFIEALQESNKKGTEPYDSQAEVRRVEGNIAWVHIPGGVDETPVQLTSSAKQGDIVQIRVAGGRAWLYGNQTSPPTDDTAAIIADQNAATAMVEALDASVSAQTAKEAAAEALTSASEAQASAEAAASAAEIADGKASAAASSAASAQASADNASEYASRALGGLSTVQSVTETLNWITAHGTMTLTSDVTLDPTHVYFVLNDTDGDYTVGNHRYDVVSEPDVADISTYYELSIDESLNNYVSTHLAVTDEGLWIIPDSGGNKVLIATGASGNTYTPAGTYIIGSSSQVLAKFTSDGITMGVDNGTEAYVTINGHSMRMLDNTGKEYFYFSDMKNNDGTATIEELFTIDDLSSGTYSYSHQTDCAIEDKNDVLVYKNNSLMSSDQYVVLDKSDMGTSDYGYVKFYPDTVAKNNSIKVKYTTKSSRPYALTFGERRSSISRPAVLGMGSMSIGRNNDASGRYSAAIGESLEATGRGSFAEGVGGKATGAGAHVEGFSTFTHDANYGANASGMGSHAEGINSKAGGRAAHAEGNSHAHGDYSHAEGMGTYTDREYSHAQNLGTHTLYKAETVMGTYNADISYVPEAVHPNGDNTFGKYALIIGNGTSQESSNAFTVDWQGTVSAEKDVLAKRDVSSGRNVECFDTLFNMPLDYWDGTCSTAAGTTIKKVSSSGLYYDNLEEGNVLFVTFDNSTTVDVSLQLTAGIVHPIIEAMYKGSRLGASNGAWSAGETVAFYYDGTYWQKIDPTYDNVDAQLIAELHERGLLSDNKTSAKTHLLNNLRNQLIGEIKAFAGANEPTGWMTCDGRTLSITDYPELFAVIGTTYGGNGTTTFSIPDLRGRTPIGSGTGTATDATAHSLGSTGGAETHKLDTTQIPSHSHATGYRYIYAGNGSYPDSYMTAGGNSTSTGATGGGKSHNNMQPFITLNFIIRYR